MTVELATIKSAIETIIAILNFVQPYRQFRWNRSIGKIYNDFLKEGEATIECESSIYLAFLRKLSKICHESLLLTFTVGLNWPYNSDDTPIEIKKQTFEEFLGVKAKEKKRIVIEDKDEYKKNLASAQKLKEEQEENKKSGFIFFWTTNNLISALYQIYKIEDYAIFNREIVVKYDFKLRKLSFIVNPDEIKRRARIFDDAPSYEKIFFRDILELKKALGLPPVN